MAGTCCVPPDAQFLQTCEAAKLNWQAAGEEVFAQIPVKAFHGVR